ncbi:hypothetical protein CERZMDRAFT_101695 [Cercospora zeae-maydis SCOH1-5]|uniref:Uncharacterized protein n=1 Tax=Cercospora zeae-maydis SCOH1-5 TaxID=717836 RepID=A0A6A6F796_9PEZI|nr:hypothetical protein CERZMDRAFT_101695 [Cercospora zeae-maydis SCOH1-5]
MKLRSGRVLTLPKKENSKDPEHFQLFGIPVELRISIYKFVLLTYYNNYDFRRVDSIEHPILHVSPAVRNEIMSTYKLALEGFTIRLYDNAFAACEAYTNAACEWLAHVISVGIVAQRTTAQEDKLHRLQVRKTEAFEECIYVVDMVKDCLGRVQEQFVKWEL